MKLLRVKITDPDGFRSLGCGFEHHFRTDWSLQDELAGPDSFAPFVCAGRNGSGKSNLLEALAAIFLQLEVLEKRGRKNGVGFTSERCCVMRRTRKHKVFAKRATTSRCERRRPATPDPVSWWNVEK